MTWSEELQKRFERNVRVIYIAFPERNNEKLDKEDQVTAISMLREFERRNMLGEHPEDNKRGKQQRLVVCSNEQNQTTLDNEPRRSKNIENDGQRNMSPMEAKWGIFQGEKKPYQEDMRYFYEQILYE